MSETKTFVVPDNLTVKIFDDVDLSTIYRQAFIGTKQLKKELIDLINNISKHIKTPVDVQFIGPTLSSLINASVNNDSSLIDIANSVAKIMAISAKKPSGMNSQGNDALFDVITQIQLQQIKNNSKNQINIITDTTKTLSQVKARKAQILKNINQDQINYTINQNGQYQKFQEEE